MALSKSLKILHLATHFNVGGIASYILLLGAGMVGRGHEVWVATSGGNLTQEAQDRGLRCVQFPIRTKNEFHPKLFWALPGLVRLVKKEKFDLIHAHTRVAQVLANFISKLSGIPYITTAHGFYKRRLSRRIFPAWGKRVVAVSALVAEELEKTHKVPKAKVRIVPNAMDVEAFQAKLRRKDPVALRHQFGIENGAFVIGNISRLVGDKGHAYLVEAAARFFKKHKNIFLLIIGDGRERPRLEKLIKKRGLQNHTRLVASTLDVTEPLSVFDAFVHPATFREGFGLSMIEAMVAGIPVVATDIWAVNSIIRNRVNGFLVKPKSAEEIAEALSFILENPQTTSAIAENGRALVKQSYSIERLLDEMETVYTE